MNPKRKARQTSRRAAPPPRRTSGKVPWIILTAVLLVSVVAFTWWKGANRRDQIATGNQTSRGEASVALNSPETAQRLIGRWQRMDAGYVIEIRHVNRFGVVEAAYLNPDPIHVSQARMRDTDGTLELFIELMDVGYPGATYELRYSREHDVLVGLYNQPTAGRAFEVAFERK